MRSMMFIVVVVAAIIVLVLYLQRMQHVPADVRSTLGDSVKTMQQVGDAVRAKVESDMEKAQKRLDEAVKQSGQ